ncbi:SPOR domain-containing protein [Altererythrobacter xixiisoli]|uniref:SPOR domain-containing protein n=1 Tax=Croceibacterium xixiisoli TaxID=1476466 RepID=A0A6I4TRZ4_9SPHN|nr:SPOR domain-containing protein [Croceibacterium xixiisoli]MXO98079.1 SPOR domain-containing protein [Croceibacterium xixiisoli]
MSNPRNHRRFFGYAVTTALAGVLLSSCATEGQSPRAEASAGQAQDALAVGQTPEAIRLAEEAVVGEPRNASYRAMLGRAYLDAGRFASAASAFDDAMTLGDTSARTALSMALSLIGEGKQPEAVALLGDWEKELAAADIGLAYALAGDPARGISVLESSIRGGQNTAKSRQNLAYSYALAGRWREARLMAQQDVPADQIDSRIDQWSRTVAPEAYQARIATLLNVPANVADAGQPARLALNTSPEVNQVLAEAAGAAKPSGELPALAAATSGPQTVDPTVALEGYRAPAIERPRDFQTAFATQAPAGGSLATVAQDAVRFAQSPEARSAPVRQGVTPVPTAPAARAVQQPPALAPMARPTPTVVASVAPAPARPTAAPARPAPAPTRVAAATPAPAAGGNRQVQLGSFTSEQGARRAWGTYVRQYPELANHRMVITQANVNGRQYWRVAAGGMNVAQSNALCGKVKAKGSNCIAMAEAPSTQNARLASR